MSNEELVQNVSPDIRVETLHKQGDVILVIGTGNAVVKLKIHSRCMSAASPVFQVMFGPNWAEGKALSEDQPKEKPLPDDDPYAMAHICRILHFSENLSPLEPEKILHMALLLDKYQISSRVKPSSLLRHSIPKTTEERLYCLAAAKCSGIWRAKWTWAFDLVAKHSGSFADYLEHELLGASLSHADIFKLQEIRTTLQVRLMDLISEIPCSEICGNRRSLFSAFQNLRGAFKFGKLVNCPALDLIVGLKRLYSRSVQSEYYVLNERPETYKCKCASELFDRLDEIYRNTVLSMQFVCIISVDE